MSVIIATFPAQRRGMALGVWGGIAGLATIAGPTIGGLLVSGLGWRWIFFVNLPVGVLAIVLAALPVGSTDLLAMSAGAGGSAPWGEAAHWCAVAAFGLVILVETGRQPIDNPDTHLELTMIHEGPLLEYAGRDLALLEWSAAARHWIVLVLAVELFGPHWGGFWAQLGWLALGLVVLCAALAATETAQAKMRILRAPGLIAGGCALALVGLASALVGGLV